MARVCNHCGENIWYKVTCPICGKDISDVAYHSGPDYAFDDHRVAYEHFDEADWAEDLKPIVERIY